MRREELVRKLIHVSGAVVAPLSLAAFGWTVSVGLVAFMIAYLAASLEFGRRGVLLPMVAALVEGTRRETERWPLAPLEYLGAILLTGVLLPAPVFLAAIACLAVGDGFAALAGIAWGRHKLPWNKRKSWEGTAVGIVAGAAASGAAVFFASELPVRPWIPGPPLAVLPLVLVAGFALLLAVVGTALRVVPAWRSSRIDARHLPLAFLISFLVAVAVAALLDIASWDSGLRSTGWDANDWMLASIAGSLAMAVESFLRGHDNLGVPFAFAASFWLLGLLV